VPDSEKFVLNNRQQNFTGLARPSADDSPLLVFESIELAVGMERQNYWF
jgi:hypothetical protein